MPISLVPVVPIPITNDMIRMWLRDAPGNNALLGNVQFGYEEISLALTLTVSAYNTITPQTGDVAASIPLAILMPGVASYLMMSEAFLQLRNDAMYQDGLPGPINLDGKFQLYSAFSQQLAEQFRTIAQAKKIQDNAESTYNQLGSGYRYSTRLS